MGAKIMGSTLLYMTLAEAAQVLGVSVDMVRVMDRKALLEPHYPEGAKAGRRYLSEDIYALAELRAMYGKDFTRKLPQIVMKASVAARRCERKLDELMTFLGMSDVVLGTEKDDVVLFHMKVTEELARTDEDLAEKTRSDVEIMGWAKKLVALNEDYFELVRMHVLEETPWQLYLDLAQHLVARAAKGTKARMFMEHARANVRNAAYFYERAATSPRAAKKAFPGEHYSKRLVQRLLT